MYDEQRTRQDGREPERQNILKYKKGYCVTALFCCKNKPVLLYHFRESYVGIFIRIYAVYVNSGQRLLANEIILVQTSKRKAASNGHGKAVRAAAINREPVIKDSLLVMPVPDGLVSIVIGDHGAVGVEGKNVFGKLRGVVVFALHKRTDFPFTHRDDVCDGKLRRGGIGGGGSGRDGAVSAVLATAGASAPATAAGIFAGIRIGKSRLFEDICFLTTYQAKAASAHKKEECGSENVSHFSCFNLDECG